VGILDGALENGLTNPREMLTLVNYDEVVAAAENVLNSFTGPLAAAPANIQRLRDAIDGIDNWLDDAA